MSDKPPETEFDRSDLDLTPAEGRTIDKVLDHAALVEQGKRIAVLESHIKFLEEHLDRLGHELHRLRKLMSVWVSGD